MMTREQEAQIRKSIENEDEVRQRTSDPKPMHQNALHRRLLLAEVDRLRDLLAENAATQCSKSDV